LHYALLGNMRNKILLLLAFFLGLILVTYLWVIPWIAVRIADNFSKEYEISLGNNMYQALMMAYTDDTTKSRLLNTFYEKLHFEVNYPIEVTVVESDEANAFAIPGGHVIVFDAILDEMKTPEELSGLLAHEVSHIQLRHSLKNLARTLARKMFLSIVIGSESRIAGFFIDNADDLKGLEYSRSLETEADNNGLQLMAKSGIDQRGMLRLMELLQKETVGKETPFLSTHPVFKKRIENIRNQIRDSRNNNPDDELRRLFHEIYE